MNPLAALGFAFIGSIIGFLAGIFVTVAHPLYLKHREDLLKARESRRRVQGALDGLTKIVKDEHARHRLLEELENMKRGR